LSFQKVIAVQWGPGWSTDTMCLVRRDIKVGVYRGRPCEHTVRRRPSASPGRLTRKHTGCHLDLGLPDPRKVRDTFLLCKHLICGASSWRL
jgi:hypothetical protein